MRMPFSEFISSGDLKFLIVFAIFTLLAFIQFIKKIQSTKREPDAAQINKFNKKINNAAFWVLISSVLSLLLGFMHSFYFIGKAGGMAPGLIFQGVSYALITPVLGISLYMICKIFSSLFNQSTNL